METISLQAIAAKEAPAIVTAEAVPATAATIQSAPPPRQYALDWLRVIAFLLLVPYHTSMFFVTWDFHFKNPQTSETLNLVMLFLNQWRLPLLLLISGAGVAFALRKRTAGAFTKERFKRLFIPVLFGMLVVVPPQIYYERVFKGVQYESYFAFWRTVFEFQPYPQGSFSWHHLWFVVYILVYSMLALPLFLWLRGENGRAFMEKLTTFFEKPNRLLLLALPLWLEAATLAPFWDTTHDLVNDWYNFTVSLTFFVFGYVISSNERLLQAVDRFLPTALKISAVCYVLLYGLIWFNWLDLSHPYGSIFDPKYDKLGEEVWTVYRLVKFVNIWCVLLALVGLARKFLNFSTPFLRYANEAVYPFYILHQSVMMVIGYYVVLQSWGIAEKFTVIMVGTYVISGMLYEIIRRTPVLRPLFGLKQRSTEALAATASHGKQ